MDMNNIKKILLAHYARYPEMRIPDMVKLLYQNEYAGGHFIIDETDSLRRLREEYHGLSPVSSQQAFESIGNGLCRMYLTSPRCREVDLRTINRFFINTANTSRGGRENFEKKLDVLRRCCIEGDLPYSVDALDSYVEAISKGSMLVSHSRVYRDAYHPAYRVMRAVYGDFFAVFSRIDALMGTKDHVNVAVDGTSGAGKSSLAALIGDVYECNVFHMDDYFLTPELRTEERLNEAGGNVDYGRFKREIARGLKSGGAFSYRPYNCRTKALEAPVRVTPKPLNIIEGSYSMHPALVDLYDLKVFLGINAEEQSRRILARNGDIMHKRFMSEWVPMENRYFAEMGIRDLCDLAYDDGALV